MSALLRKTAEALWKRIKAEPGAFIKWLLLAALTGTGIGLAGTGFLICIQKATELRRQSGWLIWLLPLAGVLIVYLYRASGIKQPQGTNLVLLAVRSPEPVPLRMAPLIFISTVLTHLFGGSAGREGAALQIGGSLGFQLGRAFRLDEKDLHIITMCGMSAAFAALFGTPAAAAVFSMEVVSVGIMYYAALVPCAVSSLIGAAIARGSGAVRLTYRIPFPESLSVGAGVKILALGILCAALSVLFCSVLQRAGSLFQKYLPNPYARAALGGALVLVLTLILDTEDYLGAGENIISASLNGHTQPQAFLLKIIFTAITLGAGFKGGEIVPAFFAGSTFGCTIGGLLGLNPAVGAALGMLSVFAGVTNCPLTALILGVELFGAQGIPFYLLCVAVSYMLSGYTGLYSNQQIPYSKTKAEFIGSALKK